MSGLPRGWTSATLGEVGRYLNGRAFKKSEWSKIGRPIVRIQDLTRSGKGHNYFNGDVAEENLVRDGDLLISWAATIDAFIWRGPEACVNQHIFKVDSFIDRKFHYYAARAFASDLRRRTHGGGIVHVTRETFDSTPLLLPPLQEQARIVEKLEELLSDLDAGIAALERARANLKRYRAAVLKAAVEGRLTEKWRAAHPDVEPASKLLERVLDERRKKWEAAQLKRYADKGQLPPRMWKDKYPEPIGAEGMELPELPEGWCWVTVDQCAREHANAITDGPFGSNLKSDHYSSSGPRVIRLQNIGEGEFVDAYAHISNERYELLRKHAVTGRDVVVAMLGDVLPRSCVIPDHVPPAIVKADCAKVSINDVLCVPEYVNCALNSEIVRKRASGSIKGVGRPRLNLSHVREIRIPLPPLKEQLEIWFAVASAVDSARQQDQELDAAISRAARLRQAVLKRAFEGKLVPQDPRDEPASELLARIRTAREAGKGLNGKRKGVTKMSKKSRIK